MFWLPELKAAYKAQIHVKFSHDVKIPEKEIGRITVKCRLKNKSKTRSTFGVWRICGCPSMAQHDVPNQRQADA